MTSYSALGLAVHLSGKKGSEKVSWLIGSAVAMGGGIWSMHFIGMLAFSMPMPVQYHIDFTIYSLFIAIFGSGVGLYFTCRVEQGKSFALIISGLLMGIAIASMHYIGMEAMHMAAEIHYSPWLFCTSIAIAILASIAALYIAFYLRKSQQSSLWLKLAASLVMGFAIAGMHYTGMAAANFIATDVGSLQINGIDTTVLTIAVTLIILLIQGFALMALLMDAQIEAENRYHIISDNILDGLITINNKGLIEAFNPAAQNIFAYSEKEVIGKSVNVVMPDSYRHEHDNDLEKYQRIGIAQEVSGLRKDGTLFALDLAVSEMFVGERMSFIAVVRDVTGRKRAKLKLDESIARYDDLVLHIPVGVYLFGFHTDDSMGFEYVSPVFCQLLGIDEDAVLRDANVAFLATHPDDLDSLICANNEAKVSMKPFRWEGRFVVRGETRWIQIESDLTTQNDDGSLWSGVVSDVTERRKAEEELNEQAMRTRLILQTTQDGFWMVDLKGNLLDVNDTYCRMSGYSKEELLDMHVSEVEANETPEETKAHINTILETGFDCFETRHRCKDGSLLELEVSTSLAGLGDNRVFFVFIRAIHDRKQAEANLRIAAAAFDSQESLMITDANGVILRVNQAFTETTGYTAEETVGQTPSMLKSDRHDADFYDAMWESIHRNGAWQGEIWDRRKNGEVYPKWLSISAVKGDDGSITHYVGSHIDITERKAAEEEIENLAFFDPLTNLPNRRLLLDRLKQALVSAARNDREGALLFLDLDSFKTLNDSLGHDMGDILLQQVAQRLLSCVREHDTVARLGGDEFVILLEELSSHTIDAASQIETVSEKIIATLNQPYQLGPQEWHSTPSIGITLFNNGHQKADELFKQADIAMYQAKKAGCNTLRFFDTKMQEAVNVRADIEGDLRNAIEQQQFQLYYQIQVDNADHPLGAEALIRWIDPERGFVSPAQFIPLAEETGLILHIGQWVLDTACAQIKAWQQDPLTSELVLAVNVSAKQFHQVDFVERVRETVLRHDINPMLLKLELTESMLQDDIEETIASMNALNEIGIQFSLDDFGTGYSSLQYLKRLPLDQLKIDQSFVRDIATDSSDKAIVGTIIAMAHAMDIDVIAEGVETDEQLQSLKKSCCTHYQGYLFGKPAPIQEFEAQLRQS